MTKKDWEVVGKIQLKIEETQGSWHRHTHLMDGKPIKVTKVVGHGIVAREIFEVCKDYLTGVGK